MIETHDLRKRFGPVQALDGVSATFAAGSVSALIGPNASGKTTLIKCVLGMVRPDSGSVSFEGRPVGSDWSYREKIGYMPQIGRFPDNLTIAQLFAFMRDLRGNPTDMDSELYDEYGMETMAGKRLGALSGGTRQKVGACLAFLFRPSVLILDEPTAGLDPLSCEILLRHIRRVQQQGTAVILTSHLMNEVEQLADVVFFLQDGRICFRETPETLRRETGEEHLLSALARYLEKQQPSSPIRA